MLLSLISFSISSLPRGSTAQIQHPHGERASPRGLGGEGLRESLDGGVGEAAPREIEGVDGVGELRVELGEEDAKTRVADGVVCRERRREGLRVVLQSKARPCRRSDCTAARRSW